MIYPRYLYNEPDLSFDRYISGDDLTFDLGNGITLELVRVPAGKFMMGDNDHEVNVQEFAIGKYAVTNAQWQAVMGTKGSTKCDAKFQGDLQPVVGVSWHEARAFCQKVQEKTGRAVRLPTDAEWEYACRAGTTTPFAFGETVTPEQVNYDGRYPYGNAPQGKYRQVTVDVNSFQPNSWGIYQMHGNVWEWCLDEWHDSYANKPENLKQQGNQAWGDLNINDNDNRYRLLRGGSWYGYALDCRAASRSRNSARNQNNNIGFRVILACSS